MSLIQHVSAVEGIDREGDEGLDVASLILTKTLSHKLSYDLLPKHVELVPDKLDSLGAYEVSTVKRFSMSNSSNQNSQLTYLSPSPCRSHNVSILCRHHFWLRCS